MVRLVIVDDQKVVRRGLRRRLALEPDIKVIGEASNGREAIPLVHQLAPEVVLMDVEMPEFDGISAAAAIHEGTPLSAVIMLSIYDDAATRTRAQKAGSAGFVNKNEAVEVLLEMIREAEVRSRRVTARNTDAMGDAKG